jgi:hypothetical protein
VCAAHYRGEIHLAGQARSERIHRTVQPQLSRGSVERLRLRITREGPRPHR